MEANQLPALNVKQDGRKERLPWEQSGWLEEVGSWIGAQLARHGWQATGALETIHQRPWSAFLSQPTDHSLVYFKAPAPAFAYEARLTESLARWRPDCTVPLLGADLQRGWLLSAAAGDTLRSLTRELAQVAHWMAVMPLYAGLQLEMAARVPELLALEAPDRRLQQLPQQYEELLEDTDVLLVGQESGLTRDEHERLRRLSARFAELCRQLDAYGLPQTLVHEEVHENNVIFGDERHRFTDWSDCSVGHPFFTMLVTERALAHWLKLDETGPEVRGVRDVYLQAWTGFGSYSDLLEAHDLAYRLAMVNRALSWREGLAALSPAERGPYADSVAGWLQDFLVAEEAAAA